MTKSKNTKRALLASVLSMMLCCAMLVGSTFAWFTDSVTSGKNKIVAGNLDVELYNVKGDVETPVKEDTNLFLEDALWEPGHVEVVNLKVANLGTLALTYKLSINVADEKTGTNVAGETFKLSDHIKFALIDGNNTYADRDAAIAAAEATSVKISELAVNEGGVLYPTAKATAENPASRYVTLVVYMPTTVGNEANYRGEDIPEITLGVNLVATQTPYENDSFGNTYDENASLDFVPVSTADELINALQGNSTISLTDKIALSNALNVTNSTINGNGNTIIGGQMGANARIINLTEQNNDVSLTLNGVHMIGETAQFNSKGISAYDANNIDLNMSRSTIEAKAYAIRIGSGVKGTVNINIKDSELKGWAGFVTFAKTNAVFDNVTFTGTNYNLSGGSNSYDVVELHNGSQGSKIVFKNCTFNLTKSGEAIYGFLGAQYPGTESYSVVTYENCKFILDGKELTVDEVITEENMDYTGATVTIDGRVINP